jgi:hypothetical protein
MLRIHGTGKRPIRVSELMEHYEDVFPDPSEVYGIQAPCIPGPPLLDPAETQERNAAVVRRALRTVGSLHRPMGSRTTPQVAALTFNAVPYMLKGSIAPLAWVAFSYDTWTYARKNAGTLGGWSSTPSQNVARASKMPALPPVAWIFSTKRFAAKASFFGWYEEKFRTRPVLRSKALRSLINRYDAMLRDIQAIPVETVTREFVIEAVDCSFPDDTFRKMVRSARKECDLMREKLNNQIEEGVWIW